MLRLFHASDVGNVERFVPRPSLVPSGGGERLVWAIDEPHLPNYLLPRNCPRVTYRRASESRSEDVERFFGESTAGHIIVVESGWMSRIVSEALYLYEFAPELFTLHDADAGYWVARETVEPIAVTHVEDLPAAIADRGVELRSRPDLLELSKAVAASSLEFSVIRMRNASRSTHTST